MVAVVKRAPKPTKRQRRWNYLAGRLAAVKNLPPSREREAQFAEITRATLAIQLRRVRT